MSCKLDCMLGMNITWFMGVLLLGSRHELRKRDLRKTRFLTLTIAQIIRSMARQNQSRRDELMFKRGITKIIFPMFVFLPWDWRLKSSCNAFLAQGSMYADFEKIRLEITLWPWITPIKRLEPKNATVDHFHNIGEISMEAQASR